MTCPLALISCLSLSGLYIDTSLVIQDSGIEQYSTIRDGWMIERGSVTESGYSESRGYQRTALNPYGRLAIGYRVEFSARLAAYVEANHVSSLATSRDRGVNALQVGLRWHPFGGQR